jgi:hypothetical protein
MREPPRPSLPEHPTLSVSYSALTQWERCERAWWLAHVGAWQGWPGGTAAVRAGVPTQAAIAYRGKHLLTPDQALGVVLHELVAGVVRAVRDARRLPTHVWLEEQLRARLKAIWTRLRLAFIARPKDRMLLEHYAGRRVAPDVRERVRLKLAAATRRLLESDALADLREAARGEILCADSLDSVLLSTPELPGGMAAVPLYAAPDAVFVSERRSVSVDGVRFAPPVPQLIDWKCVTRRRDRDLVLQLACYVIYARDRLGVAPHPRAGYVGRVVDLSPRGDPDAYYLIGTREIAAAEAWLRAGVTDLARRPVGSDDVMLKAGARLREDRTGCDRCGLWEACRMDGGEWAGPAAQSAPLPTTAATTTASVDPAQHDDP